MRRPFTLACCGTVLTLLLTACLAPTDASPERAPRTQVASPTATRDTASASPPPATTAPTPSPSTSVAVDPFPVDAMADVCVTGALESGAAFARTNPSEARRAERGQDAWAVVVPGVTDEGADVMFLCTLSGTSDEFQLELRTRVDGALDDEWTTRLADVEAGRG